MTGFFVLNNSQKARSFSGLLALTLIVGGAFIATPTALAQSRETDNRLKRLENEVDTLNRAVYRGEKPASGGSAAPTGAGTEIRLQQIEGELRELRGTFEKQSHEMRMLRKDFERVTSDLELRVNDIEGGGSSVSSGQNNNGAARYTAKPTSSTTGAGKTSSDAGRLGSYVKKPNGTQSASGDAAAALYENAFAMIKASQYDAAEREFTTFLEGYPEHVLAGNAKYWLGETYYVRGNFETAARVFAEGYQKYPEGAKAADNLLKLGMSLAGLGKTEDACVALGQLKKTELAGSGPVMRRAEQEKQRLGC